MPVSDGLPSSPGPESSPEEMIKWYKVQYELLESELAEFQSSSKDLEDQLERDVETAEKRERQLKDKVSSLGYETEEWKTKYKQAKIEANNVQSTLQKEITELREVNRGLQMRLRDTEVANDDFERQQRHTESSLEDMESKYTQAVERSVILEDEVKSGEQERETLRIETQRLRDELSDLRIETDIVKEKLTKAQRATERDRRPLTVDATARPTSPRSELSPTGTGTSTPTLDTPPAKTASSSGHSDTQTPPSPPISERSGPTSKPFATPTIPKSRLSITSNSVTPRPSGIAARPTGHGRGVSLAVNGRPLPSASFRQSMSRPGEFPGRQPGLPQSQSIAQLRTLQSRMQNLKARVTNAKSKLPAPTDTPPKASPRAGPLNANNIPSSVTVRSGRRRTGGSTISGAGSLPDQERQTPTYIRSNPNRTSINQPPVTPSRDMLPPRPSSRASASSRSSYAPYVPGHSRPGSRASISNIRGPLGSGLGSVNAPNASTDRIRPKSSLSNHAYDGAGDEENDENRGLESKDLSTPTPRRSTLTRPRTSDIGIAASAIPSPSKRLSFGTASKLPGPGIAGRRQSSGFARLAGTEVDVNATAMRPPSRLNDVQESDAYDMSETF